MALEAQDAVVRLRLLDAQRFRREADEAAGGLENVRKSGERLNKNQKDEVATPTKGGLLNALVTGEAVKNINKASERLDHLSGRAKQAAVATQGLSLVAGLGIAASVKQYMEAKSAFVQLQTQTGMKASEVEKLEAFAAKTKMAASPKEIAEAFYPIHSVLKNTTKDMEAFTASLMGSKVGHEGIVETSNALLSFWNDGAVGVKNFTQEMALMDQTVGQAKMHLPELADIAKTQLFQVGGAYKVPQESLFSLIAAISAGVGPGGTQKFATVFKTALQKMETQTKGSAAAKAARLLGFGPGQIGKELESPTGLLAVFEQLQAGEGKLGEVKWKEALSNLFGGSRGIGAIATALGALPLYRKDLREGLATQGNPEALQKEFKRVVEADPHYQLELLKAQAQKAAFAFGKELTPIVLAVGKMFVSLLKFFSGLPTPLKKTIEGLVIMAALLSPAGYLLAGLAKFGSIILKIFGKALSITPVMDVAADVVNVVGKGLPTPPGGGTKLPEDVGKGGFGAAVAKFAGSKIVRVGGGLLAFGAAYNAYATEGTSRGKEEGGGRKRIEEVASGLHTPVSATFLHGVTGAVEAGMKNSKIHVHIK